MQAAQGVKRAGRGGMLTGSQLAAIAGLLSGAARLQRTVLSAAGQEGKPSEESALRPILAVMKVKCHMLLPFFFNCWAQGSSTQRARGVVVPDLLPCCQAHCRACRPPAKGGAYLV
jgi:hypothetical protein